MDPDVRSIKLTLPQSAKSMAVSPIVVMHGWFTCIYWISLPAAQPNHRSNKQVAFTIPDTHTHTCLTEQEEVKEEGWERIKVCIVIWNKLVNITNVPWLHLLLNIRLFKKLQHCTLQNNNTLWIYPMQPKQLSTGTDKNENNLQHYKHTCWKNFGQAKTTRNKQYTSKYLHTQRSMNSLHKARVAPSNDYHFGGRRAD